MLTVDSPTGVRYLNTVTQLLQARRLADPTAGVWEAADLQWWWPRDRHDDPNDARVWFDGDEPVAAVVVTNWSPERLGCNVVADADFEPAWQFAAETCAGRDVARIDMELPDSDSGAHAAARRAGFVPSDEPYGCMWMNPMAVRAPHRALRPGYRLVSRADERSRPHPMIGRNGERVEDALLQCSLYDPHCDLMIIGPDGDVAGYALFWPDPVTGVGLVEPMRVEEAHANQGLGAHLLGAGLRLLVDHGCTRLKIGVEPNNAASCMLYAGAGFAPSGLDRVWLHAGGNAL